MRSYEPWLPEVVQESVRHLGGGRPPDLIDSLSWRGTEIRWMNVGVVVVSHYEMVPPLMKLMQLDPEPSSSGWIDPPHRTMLGGGGGTAWAMKVSFSAYEIGIGRHSADWRERCLTARTQLVERIVLA